MNVKPVLSMILWKWWRILRIQNWWIGYWIGQIISYEIYNLGYWLAKYFSFSLNLIFFLPARMTDLASAEDGGLWELNLVNSAHLVKMFKNQMLLSFSKLVVSFKWCKTNDLEFPFKHILVFLCFSCIIHTLIVASKPWDAMSQLHNINWQL